MTQPPPLIIKDDEFNELHNQLSLAGLAIYLPMTLITGAVFGSLIGILMGGVLHSFTDLNLVRPVAITFGVACSLMFTQRYVFFQSLPGVVVLQALALIVVLTLLTPEGVIKSPETEEGSSLNVYIFGLLAFLAIACWTFMWSSICELSFLVSLQKSILRILYRLPFMKRSPVL